MKNLLFIMFCVFSQLAWTQTVTSPVPNLSNEIMLNKSLTYIYLYNPGTTSISTNLSIPANPQNINITVNRCQQIRAKQSCYLIVSFNSYTVTTPSLSISLNNNSSLLTTLRYNANIVESLSVNPTSLSLGTITSAGLTSAQTITVQNTGNTSISPIVSPSNSNLQISSNSCLSVILPSNSCSFSVQYNAQSSTPNGALNLSINVSPSASGSITTIPVTGTLDLPPVIIASSQSNVATGSSVDADKFIHVEGLSYRAYNAQSNNFYFWNNGHSTVQSPQLISINSALPGRTLLKIAASNTHSCAIASDNLPYCWGVGGAGNLGYDVMLSYPNGSTTFLYPVKMNGELAGKSIKDIGVGQYFSCALASDDKVYCWGNGSDGQLGNNTTNGYQDEPTAVHWTGALLGKSAKNLIVDSNKACVITTDGLLYCWGFMESLGYSTVISPVQIPMTGALAGKTVKSASITGPTNCLIASDDKPYCWGTNGSGQMGDGTTNDSAIPLPVDLGIHSNKSFVEVRNGGIATFALTTDNKLFVWGSEWYGNTGTNNPNANYYIAPQEIYMAGALAGKNIKSFYTSASDSVTCAIASDNLPYCWGRNDLGYLGIGLTFAQQPSVAVPTPVYTGGALAGKQLKALRMNNYFTVNSICGLAGDNNIYCWGAAYGTVPVLVSTP